MEGIARWARVLLAVGLVGGLGGTFALYKLAGGAAPGSARGQTGPSPGPTEAARTAAEPAAGSGAAVPEQPDSAAETAAGARAQRTIELLDPATTPGAAAAGARRRALRPGVTGLLDDPSLPGAPVPGLHDVGAALGRRPARTTGLSGSAGGAELRAADTTAALAIWDAGAGGSASFPAGARRADAAAGELVITEDTLLQDVNLVASVRQSASVLTTLRGTISSPQAVTYSGFVPGAAVNLAIQGTVTFQGQSLTFANPTRIAGSGELINAAPHTLSGAWQMIGIPVLNEGNLVASGGAAGNAVVGLGSALENQGLLQVLAGSRLLAAGPVTQSAGELVVDGELAATLPLIIRGGTVSGHGAIQGGMHLGGSLAPGNSGGGGGGGGALDTLTVAGAVTFETGGRLAIDLGAQGAADCLAVQGDVDLSGLGARLDLAQAPGTTFTGPYTVLTWTGALAGGFTDVTPGYVLAYGDGGHSLVVIAPVPEPGTLVLLGLGMVCLPRFRRARSSRAH